MRVLIRKNTSRDIIYKSIPGVTKVVYLLSIWADMKKNMQDEAFKYITLKNLQEII